MMIQERKGRKENREWEGKEKERKGEEGKRRKI